MELSFSLKTVPAQAVKLMRAVSAADRHRDFVTLPAQLSEADRRVAGDMDGLMDNELFVGARAASTSSRRRSSRTSSGWLAAQASPGRNVLAKVCAATGSADAAVALLVEARLLHALSRHPHILELVGVVSMVEPLMLLTPAMAGGTLREYLQDQRETGRPTLGMSEQLTMCNQVASAMVYLESLAIVHRALRMDCAFVGSGPADVKLAGFGACGSWLKRKHAMD